MVSQKTPVELEKIQIRKNDIEALYDYHFITNQTRKKSLDWLSPYFNWGLWVERFFLVFGFSLILTGIVFFFAFNWASLPKIYKLGSIECAIGISAISALFLNLKRILGQIALISLSVLIGVFLAVFGQIYQTGADAYQLFFLWAAIIFPFAIISTNNFLWLLWYAVASFCVYFYVDSFNSSYFTFSASLLYLSFLTLFLLVLKLWGLSFPKIWRPANWTTSLLVFMSLIYLQWLSLIYILYYGFHDAGLWVEIGAGLSLVVHTVFYLYFRFKKEDIVPLSFTYVSICVFVDATFARILMWIHGDEYLGGMSYLFLLISTLVLFGFATKRLHYFYKKMRLHNDR